MTEDYKNKVVAWFAVPESSRSLDEGSRLVVAFTRNRIMFANMQANLERYRDKIFYEMNKIHNMILADMTVETVKAMQQQVTPIVETYTKQEEPTKTTELAKGKRADHDNLPANIQKCYTDNYDIIMKIRALHAELRSIPDDDNACHASDRFPLLQEMTELDRKYHENWKEYDSYDVQSGKTKGKRGSQATK